MSRSRPSQRGMPMAPRSDGVEPGYRARAWLAVILVYVGAIGLLAWHLSRITGR